MGPEYDLVIGSVMPFADRTQIEELQVALNNLVHVVCTDGHNVLSVSLPHTLSFYAITCPDVGLPVQIQQSILASSLRSIIRGQPVYGHAAITGRVEDQSGKLVGEVISKLEPAPPTVQREWPSRVLYVPVPESPGMRLRVESLGPPVDNWGRWWFLSLCNYAKSRLLSKPNLHDPMASFRYEYEGEGNKFKFDPFGPLARRPTWAMFVKVIDALRDSVLEPYVAHELQFNLVDVHGMPLGVGYFEAYKAPGPNAITLSNQNNSTVRVIVDDLDGASSTEGETSSA